MKNQGRPGLWAFMGRIRGYMLPFIGGLLNSAHVTCFASWFINLRVPRAHTNSQRNQTTKASLFSELSHLISHSSIKNQHQKKLKPKISKCLQYSSHKQKELKMLHPPAWASFDCKLLFRSSTGPTKPSWMNPICFLDVCWLFDLEELPTGSIL